MSRQTVRPRPPKVVYGDHCAWIIATDEDQARRDLTRGGWDEDVKLTYAGWAFNIGWDRDVYETRTEFREATGMYSYWEFGQGDTGPPDGVETAKWRRAWEIGE